MQENHIFNVTGEARVIIVLICRIRHRILEQAWARWTKSTGISHDYETDARIILSRKLHDDELRTELEIEVLYKWIASIKDIDPTGIATTIYMTKKKSAIYSALQQIRLEFYDSCETVLFQGDLPRPEDGHFTVLRGECEVLQFPDESVPLLKLLHLAKRKKWDESKQHLFSALVLAKIGKYSGFGELSTLTGVKRAATIRTNRRPGSVTEILILPKDALLDCLNARRESGVAGADPSEAVDFMRQSGLANRISPKDLVAAAGSMIKRTLYKGDILYCKGQDVQSMYLVVSGDLLLDTGDITYEDGRLHPFQYSNVENCYHLGAGSILGDEGVCGQYHRFESTAVVVSDAAVVFEAVGFGLSFLSEKIEALRYCAMSYIDKSRWSPEIYSAEQMNLYTYFNSLRKCVAQTRPYRDITNVILDNKSPIYGIKFQKESEDNITGNSQLPSVVGGKTMTTSSKATNILTLDGAGSGKTTSIRSRPITPGNTNNNSNNRNKSPTREIKIEDIVYPTILNKNSLHRAVEISKIAKKTAHHFFKMNAKDNFLSDQVSKNSVKDNPEDLRVAEAKFKKNVADHKARSARQIQIKQKVSVFVHYL